MKRFSMRVFVFVFACLTGVAVCRADELAAVTGLVTDPNGRSVPGVTVLITNLATNVTSKTLTNDQGIYRVPALQPGIYRMTMDKDGFKSIVKSGVELHVQDVASINFELQVGSVSETVTVQAGGMNINTTDAAVSTIVDRQFAENLPLNGRSFNTLLQLTPGVVIAPATDLTGGQFSIAGQRSSANNFSVDGASANFGIGPNVVTGGGGVGAAQAFSALGGTSSLVSVDALQEFRVETSSFAPEFGRTPGGQVILSTRSGTNNFRGALFDYFRNDVMDANDWFANQAGNPRAPERHNDFGGVLGGPILKDKTFFFFSYEGARLRLPQTQTIQVPSLDVRQEASPGIAPFLNTFPLPNGPISPGDSTAQFTGTYSNQATLDATSIRVDHTFNDRYSIFGRYNYAPSKIVTRNFSLSNVQAASTNTTTLTVGLNMALNNRMLNTVRWNYSKQESDVVYSLDSFGGAVPVDPSLFFSPLSTANSLASYNSFDTGGYYIGPGGKNQSKQINLVDDLTITAGVHQIKVGGDYRALFLHKDPGQYFVELLTPTEQDLVSTGTADLFLENAVPPQLLTHALSLYAQDTWKSSPRLTITYGLRWELNPFPTPQGQTRMVSWLNVSDPANLTLAPPGTSAYQTVYHNFAPRLGIAYKLTDKGDFVLRAGGGIFYDLGLGDVGDIARYFPNFGLAIVPGVSFPMSDVTPYLPPTPSLQPPWNYVYAIAPNIKTPRSYQWNLAFEKAFGTQGTLSATYVGQAGRELLRQVEYYQPNANFPNIFALQQNNAFSNYHSLQVQYRRPLTNRLQALLNYTWSHSLDNASSDSVIALSPTVVSAANDYGDSDFDVRQSFSGALTFDIPAAGKSAFVSAVTRGWCVDSVIVARTGFPLSATYQVFSPGLFGIAYLRPDLVPGQSIWTSNSSAGGGKSLNLNAFSFPNPIREGTEGRNVISGFGFTQVDMSIARKFALTERLNLQFRADAFNVLNHPNFTNPVGYVDSGPVYLQSSVMLNQGLGGLNPLFQEGGPRSLQLSLKLTF